jgi:hypothetical protein
MITLIKCSLSLKRFFKYFAEVRKNKIVELNKIFVMFRLSFYYKKRLKRFQDVTQKKRQ